MHLNAVVRPLLKAGGLAALVALGLVLAGKALADPSSATPKVVESLDQIRNLTRPQQDGYATAWDGNKYVQCHALSDQSLRCEAAGAMMQPSLADVLTPERKQRLTSLGWRLDPRFGVYTQVFPPTLGLDQVADHILTVLRQAYDADVTHLEVQTRWVARQACPPRRGLGQGQAGLVDDDPQISSTAVHGCALSDSVHSAASVPAAGAATPASPADVLVVDVPVASDPAVVDEPVAVPERRGRRRERHSRISSGHRESRGTRRSRSGGHGSHHK